jgi:SAM-dependent methyltransferase
VRFSGTKEIKEHVNRVLTNLPATSKGARAIDFPAGNGVTSECLHKLGLEVLAIDLFPELFRFKAAKIIRGDLSLEFPVASESFDLAVCQEGIEHVGNQDHVLREFSRILKPGGTLLLTTPNYSNLKSKLSYLLCESEAFGRIMPPNEFETIWLSPGSEGTGPNEAPTPPRVYFGHCFLTGFFRLRLFAQLAGFELQKIHDSRVNSTSLLLFPLIYPLICLSAWKTARRFQRKTKQAALAKELFHWMISPKLLLENHLILEFKRKSELSGPQNRGQEVDIDSFQT